VTANQRLVLDEVLAALVLVIIIGSLCLLRS
jgi:hypothetical protein